MLMETKDKFIELVNEFRRTELWEELTDSDVGRGCLSILRERGRRKDDAG